MRKIILNTCSVLLLTSTVLLNSGCAPVVLASAAPLVGGMLPENSEVTIDEATVSRDLRAEIENSKKVTFIGDDPSLVYAAEFMERNSDLTVAIESPPEIASPSQRKRFMGTVCDSASSPELVMSFSTIESDVGAGTTMKGFVTGRALMDMSVTTDVLRCRDGWRSRFDAQAKISQGVYSTDSTEVAMSRTLGQGFGIAYLEIAGVRVAEY